VGDAVGAVGAGVGDAVGAVGAGVGDAVGAVGAGVGDAVGAIIYIALVVFDLLILLVFVMFEPKDAGCPQLVTENGIPNKNVDAPTNFLIAPRRPFLLD
jgi:hypothetical protein